MRLLLQRRGILLRLLWGGILRRLLLWRRILLLRSVLLLTGRRLQRRVP